MRFDNCTLIGVVNLLGHYIPLTMITEMAEKRIQKRWQLIYYLQVFNIKDNSFIGHVVDINADGIMLLSEKPIEIGNKLEFRLILPKFIEEYGEINFEGTCAWSKADVNPNYYLTGFKVGKLTEKEVALISKLIKRASFKG